jgi:hypothetical protein
MCNRYEIDGLLGLSYHAENNALCKGHVCVPFCDFVSTPKHLGHF